MYQNVNPTIVCYGCAEIVQVAAVLRPNEKMLLMKPDRWIIAKDFIPHNKCACLVKLLLLAKFDEQREITHHGRVHTILWHMNMQRTSFSKCTLQAYHNLLTGDLARDGHQAL